MVRMSDILKKAQERKAKERKEEPSPESKQPEVKQKPIIPKPPLQETLPQQKEAISQETKITPEKEKRMEEQPEAPKVRISSVVLKKSLTDTVSNDEVEKLYEEILISIKGILEKDIIDYKSIDIKKITQQIEKILDELRIGNKNGMLALALIRNPKDTPGNYLPYHSLNVCIFSIEIGLSLGYERSNLIELGISAVLHDIGMTKYKHIAGQPRKLADNEYNEIKKHSIEGSEGLEKMNGITRKIYHVAEQHHEYMNGSGYPKGLKEESIAAYSKIVSLIDVFEAMTHLRVYRDEYSTMDTMQEIITNKEKFNHRMIKALIEHISIFPVGSFVELNTKEIAQVIKINPKMPFRPLVNIVLNANYERLQMSKNINLLNEPNIYITQGVIKNGLQIKSP